MGIMAPAAPPGIVQDTGFLCWSSGPTATNHAHLDAKQTNIRLQLRKHTFNRTSLISSEISALFPFSSTWSRPSRTGIAYGSIGSTASECLEMRSQNVEIAAILTVWDLSAVLLTKAFPSHDDNASTKLSDGTSGQATAFCNHELS